MDELFRQLLMIARGMWRRRWVGVAVAWAVALVGAVLVVRMPERYEATARVFVDTQTVLKPLMQGLAVQPDINQQVAMVARTLITRPNIEKLIRATDLDQTVKSPQEHDALVDRLTREIQMVGGGRENLYNVSYRDTSPERAKLIVQTLVSQFIESGLGNKRRDTEDARRFLEEEIKTQEKRLEEAENRLKEFKLRNLAVTDTGGKDYFSRLNAANDELAKARLELRAAEQSRDALKRGLGDEEPVLLPEPTAAAAIAVPELDARIDALRRQLDEQLRRFTDQHPDVAATRRLIAQLEAQRQVEIDARRRALAAKPGPATNPVFQRIKIALAEADATVASLQGRVNELQSRVNQLRAEAGRVPQIEAEMAQLNRDYEIIKRQYEQLVARREQLMTSRSIDDSAHMAEFRIIDPPRVAPRPVFPNRLSLVPFVLLAALGAGLAAAFVASQLFPTIDTVRSLRGLIQRPVLGSVSMVMNDALARRIRWMHVAFAGSLVMLVMIYGAWIAWLALASTVRIS